MAAATKPATPAYAPLELGPRIIPMPKHVSPEAQQYIAMPRMNLLDAAKYPPLNDKEGWRKNIAEVNGMMKIMEDMVVIRKIISLSLEMRAALGDFTETTLDERGWLLDSCRAALAKDPWRSSPLSLSRLALENFATK